MGKRMTMKRDCTVLVKRIRAITAQSSIVEIVQLRVTVEWELLVVDGPSGATNFSPRGCRLWRASHG